MAGNAIKSLGQGSGSNTEQTYWNKGNLSSAITGSVGIRVHYRGYKTSLRTKYWTKFNSDF